MTASVFRFAPSPNGLLHLGHAYCALLNAALARERGGTCLLRIEDIDAARCTRAFETAACDDLLWLGLAWPTPILRQSQHLGDYHAAQSQLAAEGLLYPCFCTRGEIAQVIADKVAWPRDPDGSPLYPGTCRTLSDAVRRDRIAREPHAWRLDMRAATDRTGVLSFVEATEKSRALVDATPLAWGDVVVARKDIGTSYHIAVVVDDARQGITHVVRGRDLFAATSVHRVLQTLLALPAPLYQHHDVLRDEAGEKLAKSHESTPLRALRECGVSAPEIRAALGFA